MSPGWLAFRSFAWSANWPAPSNGPNQMLARSTESSKEVAEAVKTRCGPSRAQPWERLPA